MDKVWISGLGWRECYVVAERKYLIHIPNSEIQSFHNIFIIFELMKGDPVVIQQYILLG